VQIDPIAVPVPPIVTQIEAQFAQMSSPSMQAGLPSPSDPFAVLLDAATSVEPQIASPATPSYAEPAAVVAAGSGAASGASGTAIVSEASKFLGVPYVWGGSSPSGFDCSGLVQYVFGQLGVEVPRGSVAQSEVGAPVASLAEAQPGDLLFFEPGQNGAPPGKPGHVAIYIGDDQMIAAPQTGETVQVQPVPCTPLAIRRVQVPGAAGIATAGTATAGTATADIVGSGTATANLVSADSASGPDGSVQMGTISVPAQYAGLVQQASASSGTPAPLLAAILFNESRFEPGVVSAAGAEGIAQFMPATAAAHGVNPYDPSSAIPGAADLLAQFHASFASWTDAVAAYAAGGGAVEAAGGVPQDGSTPAYVAKTLAEAEMAPGS
jgi:cell wall-associated NlpC family hydrolase